MKPNVTRRLSTTARSMYDVGACDKYVARRLSLSGSLRQIDPWSFRKLEVSTNAQGTVTVLCGFVDVIFRQFHQHALLPA